MKKSSSYAASRRIRELEPYNRRRVSFTKFKPDLSPKRWAELFPPVGGGVRFPGVFFFPIETLSPTKTVGLGRTNLTIIRPMIVQTDATVPYAGFDRRLSPSRNPGIQMHFEPGAYGITSVGSYVMVFTIEVVGQSTFHLSGFAGSGTVSNAGTKVLSGQTTVSLIFKNVPPAQQTYVYLEQTAGGAWNCYSIRARYPALVLTQ